MNHSKNGTTESASGFVRSAEYVPLLSTNTIFELDLVGENLRMNGIDLLINYPDMIEQSNERPTVFVRAGQKEQALSVLTSLELMDFIIDGDE